MSPHPSDLARWGLVLFLVGCSATVPSRMEGEGPHISRPGTSLGDDGPVVVVAVQGIDDRTVSASRPGLGLHVTTLIVEALTQVPGVMVVQADLLPQVLREQRRQHSGVVDDRQIVTPGRLAAAQGLVTGRLGVVGDEFVLDISLVELSRGVVLETLTRRGRLQEMLGVGQTLAVELARRLPDRLRGLSVPPDHIGIPRGGGDAPIQVNPPPDHAETEPDSVPTVDLHVSTTLCVWAIGSIRVLDSPLSGRRMGMFSSDEPLPYLLVETHGWLAVRFGSRVGWVERASVLLRHCR